MPPVATLRAVGIDVGARRLDAVALASDGRVLATAVLAADDLAAVVDWTYGAAAVAVDAPDLWSTAPHADDEALPPKFRSARCAEIGLGRLAGIWVPWTTPVERAPSTWIDAGVKLWAALRAAAHEPLEVYPHAIFRVLNGGRRPAKKQTVAGRHERRRLLRKAGVATRPDCTHDVLDATAAALVALHYAGGVARAVTCGHDGSAIWLPAPLRRAETTK